MFQWMNKQVRKKKGFTLIELIVVIAILAVLAVIAVPRIAGITTTAKVNADMQQAKIVHSALQVYLTDHATAPGADITVGTAAATAQTAINVVAAALNTAGVLSEATAKFNDPTKISYVVSTGEFKYNP